MAVEVRIKYKSIMNTNSGLIESVHTDEISRAEIEVLSSGISVKNLDNGFTEFYPNHLIIHVWWK